MTRHPSHPGPRGATGFSLVEMMIAIGIFAIGAIAVASIFPVAALLQKQTMDDVHARSFTENAVALVYARGFRASDLSGVPDQVVTEVPLAVTSRWELTDRSYPTQLPLNQRRMFWVPLFFDDANDGASPPDTTRQWRVYLFVVRGMRDGVYNKGTGTWAVGDPASSPGVPGVTRIAVTPNPPNGFNFTNTNGSLGRLVRVGDKVLGSDGITYKVTASTAGGITVNGLVSASSGNQLWFVHPGNRDASACVDLLVLQNAADNRLVQ